MEQETIYQILLVRAVEEDDPRGERLPFTSREEAGRRAGENNEASDPGADAPLRGKDWKFLARRASYLAPLASGIARVAPYPPSLKSAAIFGLVAAFLLGAASHAAGLAHSFHLFAGPFVFLLVWNLTVVSVLIFRLFWPARADKKPGPTLRLLGWWQDLRAGGRDAPPMARHFIARWLETIWPSLGSRLAAYFHAASLTFALGLVACVYVRGLSSQYAAGWESTWLEARHVRQILGTILHPASALTGIPLPADDQEWETLRFSRSGTGVPAGKWIHLHAVTLGLFAILPRALFGMLSWFKGCLLARTPPAWPAGDNYARRVLGGARRGGETIVGIFPYGFKSTTILTNGRYKDTIARLCAEVWGREALARWKEPIHYGGEIHPPDADLTSSGRILLFDIHATPEDEVHGEAIESMRGNGHGSSLLVAIETAEFPEERISTRLAIWSELSRHHKVELIALDEGMPVDNRRAPADHLTQL